MSPVMKMFHQTASVLDANNNIVEFPNPACIGNQALYLLICSKVDNFYRNLIRRQHNYGDKALILLKTYCANCTLVDKNPFHREFTNLQITQDESATHFLKCFTLGKSKAVIADNTYSDDETVDLFLAAMNATKNVQYLYVVQHFLSARDSNHHVFLMMLKGVYWPLTNYLNVNDPMLVNLLWDTILQNHPIPHLLTGLTMA